MSIDLSTVHVLFDHWSLIDHKISNKLLDIGEDLTAPSALDNVFPFAPLGCGQFGCVYPTRTPNERWVVKISLDPFEGPLTQLAFRNADLRDHPGIAYILGLWQLPQTHTVKIRQFGEVIEVEHRIWVILREDIDPVQEKDIPYPVRSSLGAARDDAEVVNQMNDLIEERGPDPYYIAQRDKSLDVFIKKLEMAESPSLFDFMTLYYEETGVALADIHAGNIGLRIHDTFPFGGHAHPENTLGDYYVIFDLGASKLDPGVAPVALLQNPGIPVMR
jgi:hypothetical protein